MTEFQNDVQTGKIPLIVTNSGTTSHCRKENDLFLNTGKLPTKVFHTPLEQTAKVTKTAKLIHQVYKLAQTVHIVPWLQNSSLLSISKFAENYTTIFTPAKSRFLTKKPQKFLAPVGPHSKVGKTQQQAYGKYPYFHQTTQNTTACTTPANKLISSKRAASTLYMIYQA